MKGNAFMKDWVITLIKHKDIVKKNIQSIKNDQKNDFIVTYPEGEAYFLVRGVLDEVDALIDILNTKKGKTTVILINSKNNLQSVIDHWDQLSKYELLTIYFINPFSVPDSYWVIRPHIHNKVCDDAALKPGLKAMFSSVEEISEEAIEKRLKAAQ